MISPFPTKPNLSTSEQRPMPKLAAEFEKFYNNIKLNKNEHYANLQLQKKLLLAQLRKWLKAHGHPTFEHFPQGSYALDTGVRPYPKGKRDYDLDIGLKFNINTRDYLDCTIPKQWVKEALSAPNVTVTIKDACVRIEGKNYHIDFAIYGYKERGKSDKLEIAKGKRGSQAKNKKWENSSPFKLKKIIDERFSKPRDRAQFKRIICYLKRWKDNKFHHKGTGAPTGIALTAIALKWFQPHTTTDKGVKYIDDLSALKHLVNTIARHNYGLNVTLPVRPGNNLFEEMKKGQHYFETYQKKMNQLKAALNRACNQGDPYKAAKELHQQFGDAFPLPNRD